MSLNVYLEKPAIVAVFDTNITHNLIDMAQEAGLYEACWHPEKVNATHARDIIPILEKGIADMEARPDHYKQFDAPNGWGSYIHFLPWLKNYLAACREYPDATIRVSR